jgi:glucose-1-phosphate thymidylyltransferase
MGRGLAWLDAGKHDSLLEASQLIQTLERRQGLKIACPREIAWRARWINNNQMQLLAEKLAKSDCSKYLIDIVNYEGKL